MPVTFVTRNLKDCLTKNLILFRTSNHSVTPNLDYYGNKTRVEFNGSCLKQDSVTFDHRKNCKHLHCL